jgi:hypothetical protein
VPWGDSRNFGEWQDSGVSLPDNQYSGTFLSRHLVGAPQLIAVYQDPNRPTEVDPHESIERVPFSGVYKEDLNWQLFAFRQDPGDIERQPLLSIRNERDEEVVLVMSSGPDVNTRDSETLPTFVIEAQDRR